MQLSPPLVLASQLVTELRSPGHAVLAATELARLADASPAEFDVFGPLWNDLPPDGYLLDGGRYRRRRQSCFVVAQGEVTQVAHRAHWQPVEYNALHGGLERWFEPIAPSMCAAAAWHRLLAGMAATASAIKGIQPWYVEAHQFRIDTTDGIGRPTPEGAHRDGVDFVAVILVDRVGVKGGETRVFEAAGPAGIRFTLSHRWTLLMLDDEQVVHESTPIQPLVPGAPAYRDTLVVTLRRTAFQGPP